MLGERNSDYATNLNNLADLLQLQGDYSAARHLYEQALAIRKDVLGERHPDYAASLSNLALLLQSQGDYAAARPLYERALAIRKDVLGERHPGYASILNNLAALLSSQGDYAAARPLYERALAIQKDMLGERNPDYARSLSNLALLLSSQGDYAAAKPLYEHALAIDKDVLGERHSLYVTTLNNLAELLLLQGDYTAARPLFQKAVTTWKDGLGKRHPLYVTGLSNLGFLLWAQGEAAGATPLLKQALEITQGNLDLAATAQSERQQLAMAQSLRWALDVYLSVARMVRLSPGDTYRDVLASKGAILQRQRRLRALRRRFQADPRSQPAQRFADYERTVKQLATLAVATPDPKQAETWRNKVADLSRRKDELEAELTRLDSGFRTEQGEADRTPDQLQAALPGGTVLIDFLVYSAIQPPDQGKGEFKVERSLVAFVVRRDQPIARVDLGPIAPIQKAIDEWRPLLIGRKTAPEGSDPAQTLRRLIWEPVEQHLDGITSVLVSPDGALGLVPLAALPGKDPSRYLIEERSIAVVPVPRMLGLATTIEPPGQGSGASPTEPVPSLLLAGNIDYGGDPGAEAGRGTSRSAAVPIRAELFGRFSRLPATGDEIASIGRDFRTRFPGAKALELAGKEATEEAFRRAAPRSRYLHLATHGYFAPAQLRSALGPKDPKVARPGVGALGAPALWATIRVCSPGSCWPAPTAAPLRSARTTASSRCSRCPS